MASGTRTPRRRARDHPPGHRRVLSRGLRGLPLHEAEAAGEGGPRAKVASLLCSSWRCSLACVCVLFIWGQVSGGGHGELCQKQLATQTSF